MISSVAISNQTVTVNQTSNGQCSSSSLVLNRVHWFRRRQISPEPRPHKKSTKILSFGIFMIGVVILSVSLIIGIEFPLYVSRKVLKDRCIQEKKHVLYDSWARDTDYRRINRVYFWVIDNADDFINGVSAPKFVERGPYVYTETRRKLNVIFSNHRLSYQTWVSQTFDAQLTLRECGTTCLASDNVTGMNTELLQKLFHFGGWDNYMKAQRTHYVKAILDNMSADQNDEGEIYKYLSCFSESCSSHFNGTNTTMIEAIYQSLSLGAFLRMNDTQDKRSLLETTQFTTEPGYLHASLIKTIYAQVSTNVSMETFSETTKLACLNESLKNDFNSVWSIFVTKPEDLPTKYKDLYTNSSANGTVYMSRDCSLSSGLLTLMTYLQNFLSRTSVVWTLRVCDTGASTNNCDEVSDTLESVLAFLSVVVNFNDVYLLNYVTDIFKTTPDNNLVWTRRQLDLTVGYNRVVEDTEPFNVKVIKGLLDHHTDFVDAYHRSPVIVVSTCLDGATTDNNMVIREYDGTDMSPDGVHPNNQQPISGRISCFPPSGTCRACVKPTPKSKVYEVFTEEVQRSLTYRQGVETDSQGVLLYEYNLDEDDLRESTSCGLINVTLIRNYPAFIGNPYYIQSDCEHVERHTQNYRREELSYIKVEPLTGIFWEQSTRLQTSALIQPEYTGDVVKPLFKDVTYIGQPLPVYWVEKKVEIVQSEIDTFQSKINHLMKVSCGGLIGLTLLSCLIMGLSVFVGLLSNRKNKVQPTMEENVSSVPD